MGRGTERGVGQGLPVGTVTFLLSDVAGSTAGWERSSAAMAQAIARHYELVDAAVAVHGGIRPVEQGEGDSTVSAFARAGDAVAAALAIQQAFAAEDWPEEAPLRMRLGLHTGDAELRDEDNYFGLAIIRCARLRNVGHGGQTLLSDATRDLVVDHLPGQATVRNLGTHRLKDLGRAERIWQLCAPGLDDDFPPLRSLDSLPNNLPGQLTAFVGREAELAELQELIAANRLVTLTGAGGSGKSRLALHAVADAIDAHADGAWWVELAPLTNPTMVPYALATTLGLREEPDRPLIDALAEDLRGRDVIVALDNCEQLLDATAALVEHLLQAAPNLRIVATSREPLGVTGEVSWRAPSMDEPTAFSLFVQRARQVRPGFVPDNDESEVIAHICRRLDGLPLAIELAAARVRMMQPANIAAGLDDRFRLLTGGVRSAMPRQQTLEASVAWSYNLLDEPERAVLRRLSVFAAGFTLDAAEAVGSDDQLVDRYGVLDVLSRLIDKSLVQVDNGGTRYRLLETIRQYAGVRLAEAGETEATRGRHLQHFVALASRAEPELIGGAWPLWRQVLEVEHDNLRVALEWAAGAGDHEVLLRLATSLTLFWAHGGHAVSGGRWLDLALSHDDGPSVVRARALWAAAHVAVYADDMAKVFKRAPAALTIAELLDDPWTAARAQSTWSYVQLWFDPASARASLDHSIKLAESIGDTWAVADALKMTSIAWLVQDNYDAAAAVVADLAVLARQLDNMFFLAWCHTAIAYGSLQRGDFPKAKRELERALALCREVGDPATGGLATALLGDLQALSGERAMAWTALDAFVHRARSSGGDLGVPFALFSLARLHLSERDPSGARAVTDRLLATHRHGCMLQTTSLALQGAVQANVGEDGAATTSLTQALELARKIGSPRLEATAEHHLGVLARRSGDTSKAESLFHHGLALRHQAGLRPGVIESLEALAGLAAQQESAAEAARLFAAAEQLRVTIGAPRWPAEQHDYDEDLTSVHRRLGDEAFATAWSEGEALNIDDAVAYASRARGERKRPSSGWASLTPTEVDVVRLAAEGLTNPEIGTRLFIGRGTVKTHLSHIFTKLDVTTRAELAAKATRRDL